MRDDLRLGISMLAATAFAVVLAGCSSGTWQFWKSSSPAPTAHPVAPMVQKSKAIEPPSAAVDVEAAVPPASFSPLPALADVRFRSGQVRVGKADERILNDVVRWLKAHPATLVLLEGHTDDLGTAESNQTAAESRAESVKAYLVAQGIEATRISVEPVGSERPLCLEKTDACRAQNRRVHVLVKQP
jgi:outer membrane protein OmpA-like peptidoglycan-associated protein